MASFIKHEILNSSFLFLLDLFKQGNSICEEYSYIYDNVYMLIVRSQDNRIMIAFLNSH